MQIVEIVFLVALFAVHALKYCRIGNKNGAKCTLGQPHNGWQLILSRRTIVFDHNAHGSNGIRQILPPAVFRVVCCKDVKDGWANKN
jgi:hypothetical protein